ncbi:MAG: SGNH/GDSL hydrolase family protein [Sandaracinaceae bacterium]
MKVKRSLCGLACALGLTSAAALASATPDDGAAGAGAPARGVVPDEVLRLDEDVLAHLRAIAEQVPSRRADRFMKVGDSATVARTFMACLSDPEEVDLGGYDGLRPTLQAFRGARVLGADSFRRESRAAGVGWRVAQVLRGSPPPLYAELADLSPRFALVLFGANGVEEDGLGRFRSRMTRLVDGLLRRGVLPVLYTLPPRNDDPAADALVPRWNAVLAELASARHLPLIDLHTAFRRLPQRGLSSDGVHPSAPVRGGRAYGCEFNAEGLRFGQNLRNLLTLKALHRLRAAL